MIEKRFKLIKGVKKGTHSGIWDNQHYTGIGDELWVGEVVAMLNEGVALAEENKELKAEIEQSDSISKDIVCADIQHQLLKVTDENKELQKENEQLKKRLSLYNEDEIDNYLRTHPMPTTTITTKRRVIPLNMRHRGY